MPPKNKFTKEEILQKALSAVRERGSDALTARGLAARLGTSCKPIFGLFQNMEALRHAVIGAAKELYDARIAAAMGVGEYPPYKASGMAYIEFAKEEKELFKLLFMRDRRGETVAEDRESIRPILDLLKNNLGISEDEAYLFHLELWIYVHGIATMIATSYLDWSTEFISRALSDAYEGLRARYIKENRYGCDPL